MSVGWFWVSFTNVANKSLTRIIEVVHVDEMESASHLSETLGPRQSMPMDIAKPVRPLEFSLWTMFPSVNLFVILAIALGVIYKKAYANGTSPVILKLCCSFAVASIQTRSIRRTNRSQGFLSPPPTGSFKIYWKTIFRLPLLL